MKFGDGIDWNVEAQRAAKEGVPGPQPNDLTRRLAGALNGDSPRAHRWRVVDCGCNIGRFYPAVEASGLEYVGIDQAHEALDIARSRYPKKGRFEYAMLWDDWPSQLGPFDGAFCNAALQHNTHEEKRRILARIAEAVRPGGAFAMQESTVPVETKTQLRQGDWIALVESFGFQLRTLWHPNDEYAILDGYLFQRVQL